MGYEKHVYPAVLPDDLLPLWKQEISRHGLDLEFHPSFHPATWKGGYVPCKLTIAKEPIASAERYGAAPLFAGFEFYAVLGAAEKTEMLDDYAEDMENEGTPLPLDLLETLGRAPAAFSFVHGGFTWSAAEFRACWFAAAALAKITGGLLFDEWAGGDGHGYCGGDQALIAAEERSTAYENEPYTQKEAWDIPLFTGWED